MIELKIDPEFRDKIPPLTEAEYEQLKENILSDGEVYEPIAVWNGTIVDGHNRWRIICENWELLKDKYRTKLMNFSDKWAAFDWMYKKQLGRRNLTDEQKTYMIGKMYEARKKSQNGIRGEQTRASNGTFRVDQNDPRGDKPKSTAEAIGREIGVAEPTVKRSEKFAKGVDAIRHESPEAAEKILQGNSGITKALIMDLPSMEPEKRKEFAEAIVEGPEAVSAYKRNTAKEVNVEAGTKEHSAPQLETTQEQVLSDKNTSETKSELKQLDEQDDLINSVFQEWRDKKEPRIYTVDDLIEEIRINANVYIEQLKNTIVRRSTLLNEDDSRKRVKNVIDNEIVKEINTIGGLVWNG